jgi:hypothetical protein
MTRVIIATIVLMVNIVPAFSAINLVALIIVTVLVTMMTVVWAMAASDRKMSRLLLLWLLLLLELAKDTGCFVGSLALLKTAQKRPQAKEGQWAPFCLFPQTETDVPLAVQERFVCYSLAPWATPLFNRGNRHQGSWRAALVAV